MPQQRTICEVAHGSAEYWATVDLRDSVLRKPLGLQYSVEELEAEKDARHVACYLGERLAGCLILLPTTGDDIRMRHVAVAPDLQGQGIGKALVEYSEALARQMGFCRMFLHARETAVSFYERLGYTKQGDRFVGVGIAHLVMDKRL